LAPKVLVNAIAPGPILPPPGLSAQEYDAVIKATPLARWGGAEEIAKAVVFLVETDFVTGETIRVDGGRHLR
jgi:NAD(P)-dependent dehydrogenase (short-subunit alcohol dehydrogenase family)